MSSDRMLVDLTPLKGWRGFLYHSAVRIAVGLWRILFCWKISGTERIPRRGPFLLISNHPSYLDPPTLVGITIYFAGRDLSIMAWDRLFRVPIVRFWVKAYKAFPVDRANPGRGPYVTLLRILEQGGAACVFPEGSRTKGRIMDEWKPGALRAALATKATILPVTMVTTGEFWPRAAWRPRLFRRQEIVIHRALKYEEYMAGKPEGMNDKQFQDQVEARIREIINAPIEARLAEVQARKLALNAAKLDVTRPERDLAAERRKRLAEARRRLEGAVSP
jgi:1-acyl-sn-glycerol-3-phosphate acyltransferase